MKHKCGAKLENKADLVKKRMKVEDKHSVPSHNGMSSVKIITKVVNGRTAYSQNVVDSKKIMAEEDKHPAHFHDEDSVKTITKQENSCNVQCRF
jgi:hypothetical protein